MSMLAALGWSTLASAALLLGALLAFRRRPSGALLGRVMGFGAGALLAALAYDLVPAGSEVDAILWLGLGAIVFFLLDRKVTGRTKGGGGKSIMLGALFDGLPESLVLGISIATGGGISVAFLAAVLVSNLPEGMAASIDLRDDGRSRRYIYRVWVIIVAVCGVAGAVGYGVAQLLPEADGRLLEGFAAGAVLTMLGSAMIPESFERGGKTVGLAMAIGFAVTALLAAAEG